MDLKFLKGEMTGIYTLILKVIKPKNCKIWTNIKKLVTSQVVGILEEKIFYGEELTEFVDLIQLNTILFQ